MRAVLDPNVIISGLLSPAGTPAKVLGAWRNGAFELVASPLLLAEVERVLAYPKLRTRIEPARASRIVSWLSGSAVIVIDPETPPPVSSADPGDDYLIALASNERAALVSGDRHLLELRGQLPVYAATDFLALLGGTTAPAP